MPSLKLKQLQYESDMWKRTLAFMIEENIHLKNRVAEVLKEGFNAGMLRDIESFQNKFIKEDTVIVYLRNEVTELDKLLVREIFEDGLIKKKVESKIRKVRNSVKQAENEFGHLKIDFNSYLTENL
ncbi:MAG: hypothetical protein HYX40_13015 [Sphingobacteriales bacterium]|nr:hypothetical protein [Sphingobacteriales bacterium]